jgi:hypothetical protein
MLATMQRHQALRTITGITLTLALGLAGCAGGQAKAGTADDADPNSGADTGGDEESMMDDIDSYLEEEGEDVGADDVSATDGGGEDATGDDEDQPRSTPKERTEQIYGLIKAKRATLSDCYKAAKKKDPKIGTKIAVKIVLQPDGKLKSDPTIEEDRTDIANEEVRTCAIDVVKSIEYPAHPKGMETTFTYPFGF